MVVGERGATSLIFAVSAVALLGLVGLGTEGGTWYLAKRHGQNGADSGAMAGVLSLATANGAACGVTPNAAAVASAKDVSGRNGFTTGVTVNNPPVSGTNKGNPCAVEVIVAQAPTPMFAALFGIKTVAINTRAVGLLKFTGPACVLSFTDMSFKGNTNVQAPNCAMSSNATDSSAISATGSATVNAGLLDSSGGCEGCSQPYSTYQPPTTDPFAAAKSVVLPTSPCAITINGITDVGNTYNATPMVPWGNNGHKVVCGSGNNATVKVTTGDTLNLQPGTYIFSNVSLDFEGGTVQCPTCNSSQGVTIILTGNPVSKIGTLTINGNATVNLKAPAVNNFNAAFDGILFYRDANAPAGNNGNPPVSINGGANTALTGGLYFPSSNVAFSGNMTNGGASASTCLEVVGNAITFTGNSSLNISACSADGTNVAQVQAARLVE